jgi:cytochrome P450
VSKEGGVLQLDEGAVGVFDPKTAHDIEIANAEGLKLPGSLSQVTQTGDSADEMAWREVRALLVQRSRHLATPLHLKVLHERMRAVLIAEAGVTQNLATLTGHTFSRSLLPLIIDGLPQRAVTRVLAKQQADFENFSAPAAAPPKAWERIAAVLGEAATGRAIAKQLKRRRKGLAPARQDYAEAIVPLIDRIGAVRASYLVTTLLTATSSPPGMVASCVLYALAVYPEWRSRVRAELAELMPEELYSAAPGRLPVTTRFIKEVLRLWAFPLVTHRIAYRDLDAGGTRISAGTPYDLSPYVMHHSGDHWREPERFDPDRWLATDELPTPKAYVPFGFGPRSCVGASVGHAQLVLFCHLMTRVFEVELAQGAQPTMSLNGFAIPQNLVGALKLASEPEALSQQGH